MIRSCHCIRLGVLLLSCLASVASSASVSSVDTSTLRSLGLSRKEIKEVRSSEPIEGAEDDEEVMIEEEVDDEEEPWKSNEEWWKDPLAMFSDDEDEMPEEEIDETVSIINEAESLGDDIAVDEPEQEEEEEEEEETDEIETEASLVDDDEAEIIDEIIEDAEEIIEDAEVIAPSKVAPPVQEVEPPVEPEPEAKPAPKKTTRVKPAKKTTADESRQVAKAPPAVSSRSSMTSPLALLVPLFPKLQGALSNVPLAPLAASAVVVTFGINTVKNKRLGKKEDYLNDQDAIGDKTSEQSESMEEEEEDDVQDEEDEEESSSESSRNAESARRRRIGRPGWIRGVADKLSRTPSGDRMPSARELYAQVESLRQSLSKAEAERDAMEKEYERASFQVQEQHTEIKTLTTTTKYLKAQLRDNEEVQNKAIRAERRKAKEELARMKGAMVAILDKERKAMREELKRQTNELRGLLKEAMTDGDYVAEQG